MESNQKENSRQWVKGNIAWVKVGIVLLLAIISAIVFPGLIIMPIGFVLAAIVLFIFSKKKNK